MSTTPTPAPTVTMIDPSGEARAVPADAVSQAPSTWKPATKMTDPQGAARWIPSEAVDQARQAEKPWAVHPDNPGVQRMATPQGQLTYALPGEVEKFKASGHVPIDDTGNFRVDPIEGEDNVATMDRAARIAKNLPPDVLKQAIAAEKKSITPARIAANLVAGPAIVATGGLGGAVLEGTGTIAGPAIASLRAAAATPAGQMIIKEGGKYVFKKAVAGAAWAGGAGLVYKFLKGLAK